ncbi:replicative DNA helicase [Legionella fallonii]|nr:replicative DNA helicase [Legionella fallonii]
MTESEAINTEQCSLSNTHIKSLLVKAIEKIDEVYRASDASYGLKTGLTEFDNLTGGLSPSDLIIIAGRPSIGKTTLAMNIIEHIALKLNKTAILFSLETAPEISALKFICSLGRVDAHRLRSGSVEDEDWPRITTAVQTLSESPIYIDNVIEETIDTICAKSRKIALNTGNIGLIVVDYIQLLCCRGSTPENRTAELSSILRYLKILAKELNVPVIAISQLNQNVEQRTDKRPIISDLKDSESIEDDADMICFVHRNDYYDENSEDKYIAEIIVAKHRNGPQGKIRTAYLGQYGRFEDLRFTH